MVQVYYNAFYNTYNRMNLMSSKELELFEGALRNRLSFSEAYTNFENVYLYQVYKIHLTCKPTLKRLAALTLLRLEKENIGEILVKNQLPITLIHDVKFFGQYLWTIDVYYYRSSFFKFTPTLKDPEEVVGKEMLLDFIKFRSKIYFKSIYNDWKVDLKLYLEPKIFYILSLRRSPEWCKQEIVSQRNQGKIKILFLEYIRDRYFFEFHHINECTTFPE